MQARGEKVEVKCGRCKKPFMARIADRNRGWGKFCSKSCKAVKQTQRFASGARPKSYQRHDGKSPMKYKVCDTCGEPAINGARNGDEIEWYCAVHEYEARLHPFDSEALGQW